jgi:hypothetical protein
VDVRGNVQAEAFVFGYSVSSSSVPPVTEPGPGTPAPQ